VRLRDLLSKLRWDPCEDISKASISYLDRTRGSRGGTEQRLIEIKGDDILEITGGCMVIRKGSEKSAIPLHRVRLVRDSKGKVRWSRERP